MRSTSSPFKLLIFSILIFLMTPILGLACKRPVGWKPLPPLSIQQAYKVADVIFEGKFKSGTSLSQSFDWKTKFEINESFKGPNDSEIETVTSHSTCDPYPFWEREKDSQGNYIAKSDEKLSLIFWNKKEKKFLNVQVGSSSKSDLRNLNKKQQQTKK